MKSLATKILAVVCLLLFVVLLLVNRADNARHQADTDSLADCSNRLALAQANLGERDASLLNLSNVLAQCQSASTALSNQLTETIVTQSRQLTNLTLQIAQMGATNEVWQRRITSLTNQITSLAIQLCTSENVLNQTNQALVQADKDYSLLENRFHINVAERLVTERKFNNLDALQRQIVKLKQHPAGEMTADQIYAELDVEVRSNGVVHVITRN